MIRGLHAMFYHSDAVALREFFREKLGFPSTDVGDGWLIFDMPSADLGVHPLDFEGHPPSGTAEVSFFCDDIAATVADLKAKGVPFTKDPHDAGFGMVAIMQAPGDLEIMLYQPYYSKG